jgi:hypothetical protein
MQVNEWGSVTHAHGVLFKEQANGTFVELTRWPMDKLFVNAAPVAAELPDGAPVIFLVTTAQYDATGAVLGDGLQRAAPMSSHPSTMTGEASGLRLIRCTNLLSQALVWS